MTISNSLVIFAFVGTIAVFARGLDTKDYLTDGKPVERHTVIPCGNNVNCVYDDTTNTMTVSGEGAMKDYDKAEDVPWYEFRDEIKQVVIENGVTRLGSTAFYRCASLTSVVIPASVKHIGSATFSDCFALPNVTLPNNLETLGSCAFRTCRNLESPLIPASVVYIGSDPFGGCHKIESFRVDERNSDYKTEDGLLFEKKDNELIQFPAGRKGNYTLSASVTSIPFGAFEGCSLTSLTILGEITYIPSSTFSSSFNLESVVLPDSVSSIGTQAFYGCTRMKSITLPASLTDLGDSAFGSCTSLSFVTYHGSSNFKCSDLFVFGRCPFDALCVPSDSTITSYCSSTRFCKSSSCSAIEKQTNKCFEAICQDGEWMVIKNTQAIQWENKTNGCIEYQCMNETGIIARNKCDGEENVCIDGECMSTKNTNKGWTVIIDFNQSTITDVNVTEIQNTINALCGFGSDNEVTVGLKYDDFGQILRVIVLVDNEDIAKMITMKVEEATQSETCGIGLLCENDGVYLKEIPSTFSEVDGSERIWNIRILMIAIMFFSLTRE